MLVVRLIRPPMIPLLAIPPPGAAPAFRPLPHASQMDEGADSVPPSPLDGLRPPSFWQSHVSGRGRATIATVTLVTIHSIS